MVTEMVTVNAGEICSVEFAPADDARDEAFRAYIINNACPAKLSNGWRPVMSRSWLLVELISSLQEGDRDPFLGEKQGKE